MIQKVRMSNLTRKGSEALAVAMSIDDLREMAELHDAVYKGDKPVSDYRAREVEMLKKYGFNVRNNTAHSQGDYTPFRSGRQKFYPRQIAQVKCHESEGKHRASNLAGV